MKIAIINGTAYVELKDIKDALKAGFHVVIDEIEIQDTGSVFPSLVDLRLQHNEFLEKKQKEQRLADLQASIRAAEVVAGKPYGHTFCEHDWASRPATKGNVYFGAAESFCTKCGMIGGEAPQATGG